MCDQSGCPPTGQMGRLLLTDFVEKLDRNHFDRVGVVIVGKILPFVKVFHYVYERVYRIRSKYFYDGLP
jgi:hypothetical protein